MEEYKCSCCKIHKERGFFYKLKSRKTGITPYCKECYRTKKSKPKNKFYEYRRGARVRNISFSITFKYFSKILLEPCFYCGIYVKDRMGVDRVDNAIGYEQFNCKPCCWDCNRVKGTLVLDEVPRLLRICEKLNEIL